MQERCAPWIRRERIVHVTHGARVRDASRWPWIDPHPHLRPAQVRRRRRPGRFVKAEVLCEEEGEKSNIWFIGKWSSPENMENPGMIRIARSCREQAVRSHSHGFTENKLCFADGFPRELEARIGVGIRVLRFLVYRCGSAVTIYVSSFSENVSPVVRISAAE